MYICPYRRQLLINIQCHLCHSMSMSTEIVFFAQKSKNRKWNTEQIHKNRNFFLCQFKLINWIKSCAIPECESLETTIYEPIWLSNAVPFTNGKPSKCYRYANSTAQSHHSLNETCGLNFDHEHQFQCNQYVYGTEEISILNDVSCSNMLIILDREFKSRFIWMIKLASSGVQRRTMEIGIDWYGKQFGTFNIYAIYGYAVRLFWTSNHFNGWCIW